MKPRSPTEMAVDNEANIKLQVCGRMNAKDKEFLEAEAKKAGITLSYLVGRTLEQYAADLKEMQDKKKK